MKKTHKNGQMLLEALVALSVFLVALTAITITVITALSNSRFSQDQNIANKYAQEGIDKMRSLRLVNSTLFFGASALSSGTTYCLGENTSVPTLCPAPVPNVDGKYIRTITFSDPNSAVCRGRLVTITVKWNSTKCSATKTFCHESRQTTCFTQAGN